MRKIFFLAFLCISLSSIAQTQQVDSVLAEIQKAKNDTDKVRLYETLFYDLDDPYESLTKGENPGEKLKYAISIISLSQQSNYKWGLAQGYNCMGLVYMFTDRRHPNKALENFYKAADILRNLGDMHMLGGVTANIGSVFFQHHFRKRSMDTLLRAKEILESIHDSSLYLACTYEKLGIVLSSSKNYQEAIESYLKAKTIFEKKRSKKYPCDIYLLLGWAYAGQKSYNDASLYTKMGLDIAKETKDSVMVTNAEKCLDYINKHSARH